MAAAAVIRPSDAEEVCELVAAAAAEGQSLEIRGGGTKRDVGAPYRTATVVDLTRLTGVVSYEPDELVLTVRPATRLSEIEALLESSGQMLAFEPWDYGPLFGRSAGESTIGGVVAAGVAGPRRLSSGAPRDHLLGFAAVSGRGEAFRAGGKVVKNVTGYDLSKLLAGSWGQLAVLTELSLKVVPRPRATGTVVLRGLSHAAAIAAMAKALGSGSVPAAAAHMPTAPGGSGVTAIRLEGFAESVDYRAEQLRRLLQSYGPATLLKDKDQHSLWAEIREVRPLSSSANLWRLHVAPSAAASLCEDLDSAGAKWLCDWGGSLVWAGAPASADVRAIADLHGAHAMLLRGPESVRLVTPPRHPEPAAAAALAARIKQAFDPAGVLDPCRFS